jgi:uncharacterized membrane protein (UPF0136 family)
MPAAAWFWFLTSGVVTGMAFLWFGMTLMEEDDRAGLKLVAGGAALVLVCLVAQFLKMNAARL